MVLSFADKLTAQFAAGGRIAAFQGFADQAAKRLSILDAAPSLTSLRALPSNRLEALRGDRAGQTRSASISNGGFVLRGERVSLGRKTWKLSTIIREQRR
jgi:plasmid maintenance system killer protein